MAVRVTQVAVETLLAPTDGKVRVTQVAVETLLSPNDGAVRVTQVAIETLYYRVIRQVRPQVFITC